MAGTAESSAERPKKNTPRIKIQIPRYLQEDWAAMIPKAKRNCVKYEYGFTRACNALQITAADFHSSRNYCLSKWGKKKWLRKLQRAAVGQDQHTIRNTDTQMKKQALVLEWMEAWRPGKATRLETKTPKTGMR